MLRAELSGDVYLRARLAGSTPSGATPCGRWGGWATTRRSPTGTSSARSSDAKVIAGLVVGALREAYGVAHPLLLTYHAWGPAAAEPPSWD